MAFLDSIFGKYVFGYVFLDSEPVSIVFSIRSFGWVRIWFLVHSSKIASRRIGVAEHRLLSCFVETLSASQRRRTSMAARGD